MTEKDHWPHFKEIDWDCPDFNQFNLDTRDFHCGYRKDNGHKDFETLKKYGKRFFFTKEEVLEMIEDVYERSNGKSGHSYINLTGTDFGSKYGTWRMKYIRMYRTDIGWIVCDSDFTALTRTEFNRINPENK